MKQKKKKNKTENIVNKQQQVKNIYYLINIKLKRFSVNYVSMKLRSYYSKQAFSGKREIPMPFRSF